MLLNMIAKAGFRSYFGRHGAVAASARIGPSYERPTTLLDLVPERFDGRYIISYEGKRCEEDLDPDLQRLDADIKAENDPRKRDALLLAKGNLLIMRGQKEEGAALLMEVFRRNMDDRTLTKRICAVLGRAGMNEQAIEIAKYKCQKEGTDAFGYYYADLLIKEKRFEEALSLLERLLQSADVPMPSETRRLWFRCLLELGHKDRIESFIRSTRSSRDGNIMARDLAILAAEEMMRTGDINGATELYWRYADRNAIFDHDMFLRAMIRAGHERAASAWFIRNIFPRLDARKVSDAMAIEQEARRCKELGMYEEALPMYQALLKRDPNNIWLNLDHAAALFMAGRGEQGMRAIISTGEAYRFMDSRRLLDGMSFNEFVTSVREMLIKHGLVSNFLEIYDAMLKEGALTVENLDMHDDGRLLPHVLADELRNLCSSRVDIFPSGRVK